MLKWFFDYLYWFQIFKDQCLSVPSIPVACPCLYPHSHKENPRENRIKSNLEQKMEYKWLKVQIVENIIDVGTYC